jgi:hypothetical protein
MTCDRHIFFVEGYQPPSAFKAAPGQAMLSTAAPERDGADGRGVSAPLSERLMTCV